MLIRPTLPVWVEAPSAVCKCPATHYGDEPEGGGAGFEKENMMKNEYVTCAVCGKKFKGRIPKSGDGSARFPSIHWRYAKVHWHIADNTYEKQPVCNGSYRECKEDQVAGQDLKGNQNE